MIGGLDGLPSNLGWLVGWFNTFKEGFEFLCLIFWSLAFNRKVK